MWDKMINRLHIADVLKDDKLRFLRVLWCDNGNVIRSKVIHLPSFKRHLLNRGMEELRSEEFIYKLEQALVNTQALQAIDAGLDEPVPEAGLEPVKELRLVPDWSTLTMLPYAPGHAVTLGNFMLDSVTEPWELCSRGLLKRTVKRAEDSGYDVMCGAEIEFFLFDGAPFREKGALEPVDRDAYAQNAAFEVSRELIDDIADTLYEMGIELAYYNPESGPGQHEIFIHYSDPLALSDRIVYMREAIRSLALQYGVIASFMPKIFQEATGNGCHIHMSIWKNGQDALGDGKGNWGLSQAGESYVAGVLEHLPALMALTTPTPNSYKRIQPKFWSGAFKVWGLDNKEAAIRVLMNPFGGGPKQFELKPVDSSANPYIALTGIIAAGLDGVSNNMKLGEPLQRDPGNLSEEERKELGVELLPTDLEKALAALRKDEVLKSAFGKRYYEVYDAVKRFEHEERGDYDLEKERSMLLTRY